MAAEVPCDARDGDDGRKRRERLAMPERVGEEAPGHGARDATQADDGGVDPHQRTAVAAGGFIEHGPVAAEAQG